MNACKFCDHESDDDVTVYVIFNPHENVRHHQWYCKKCKNNWDIKEHHLLGPKTEFPKHVFPKARYAR